MDEVHVDLCIMEASVSSGIRRFKEGLFNLHPRFITLMHRSHK